MKKRVITSLLSLTLTLSVLFSLSGCGTTAQAMNLMDGVNANAVSADIDLAGDDSEAIAEFATSLFQSSMASEDNTLISPLSVLCALAMTVNGAEGETLAQMEETLGLSADELNEYIYAYMKSMPSDEKYEVNLVNSIWFKDDETLTVEEDFLQINADYYGAAAYEAPFDDTTLEDINSWVSENTDGMIDNILDKIPDQAVMYLINALAFDAEWQSIYSEDQISRGTFTTESGDVREIEMMSSEESMYLDDGSATGFIKYYADNKYAFVALLPNEGICIEDYVSSLTGAGLMNTIENAQNETINASIPKFDTEYSVEMSEILKSMGMTDAFDEYLADFSGLATSELGNIFINRVLHKAYICVDEKGTEAGAVTAVEMNLESAVEVSKTVCLDRPFIYMLIDCETNLPIFIGTVMDIGE
jgi:serine protease inhibitor